MNDMIKAAAEQFARENVKEAQNLLRTLGKIPAPSHDKAGARPSSASGSNRRDSRTYRSTPPKT